MRVSGPNLLGLPEWPGLAVLFGTIAILIPIITLPLYGILLHHYYKVKKQDLSHKRDSRGTAWQYFLHHCREFDAVGLILLSGGVALFLLPFNLYTVQAKQWHSALIICLLVFGIVLLVVFAIWERFLAPVTFIPYSLLLDRIFFGACTLSATLFISYYCWSSYFSSFLQVVNDLSVTDANYVVQTYTVGTVLCSLAVGLLYTTPGATSPSAFTLGFLDASLG